MNEVLDNKPNKDKKKLVIALLTGGVILFALILMALAVFSSIQTQRINDELRMKQDSQAGTDSAGIVVLSQNRQRIILIDAGHGGFDPGVVAGNTNEDDINLAITKKLEQTLLEQGFAVVLTRQDENALSSTKDADMAKRRDIIKNSDADILISIHQNSVDNESVSGPIVFHFPNAQEGKVLAEYIQQSMNKELHPPKPKKIESKNLFVLRAGAAPAVLIECGFLTNYNEKQKLRNEEYQQKVAFAIAEGINKYFEYLRDGEIPQ